MSRLALYFLGAPRFELDGQPVHISRHKAVALLAYLALTKQSHRRESLTAFFWPETDPSRGRADLRRTLSVLNTTLGAGWLAVDRESAGLNWDAEVWLDVDEFQAHLVAGRTHGHPPDETCPACLTSLADALALYGDDFLAGFTLRDSAEFDDWQFFQTQELRDDLARALERLAQGHGEQGEFELAIAYARRWVALDPLYEPAHRLLMQWYAGSGQRAAALRQYESCEQALREELGLLPEEATTRLFQAIKESRDLPLAPERADFSAAPPSAVPRHNLPVQITPFVGREDVLAEIAGRLADPACRLLTLAGPGGSGKTRLALEAGAGQLERFADGVFFAPLAPLESTEAIVPTVAGALGFSFQRGHEPRKQLLDHLRQKAVLLILDNFEHLLDGVDLVAEILRAAPEAKILVTSRARLNLEGETLFPVAGMRYPGQEALSDARQYSAVKLFLQSARRIRPAFELRDDNLPGVVQICRLVQGLPLGVLLAAGWVGVLTPAEIADQISGEIGHSLDFLETDMSDVPERLRSMRAVFDHSWRLLTEQEREVMRALSVFRGDFTRQAAERVTGASLRELKGLADKSMVQRTPAPSGLLRARGWYEIHELLRHYAAEKLAQRPEAWERAHDRHSAYYTAALQRWREDLEGGPQQRRALAEIEADIENARAAWNWAVERCKATRLDRAIRGLVTFYILHQRSEELASACRLAVERLAPAESPEEQRVLAQVLAWQGRFLPSELDDRLLRKSLALLEGLESGGHDVRREKAQTLSRLGGVARSHAGLQQSEQLLQQSLALSRALGDSILVAETLEQLGLTVRWLGEPTSVKQFGEESLAIRQSLGDRANIWWSLLNLGWAALLQGHLEEAERTHRESLASFREMDLRPPMNVTVAVSTTLSALGGFTEARALLEEGVAITAEVGLPTFWLDSVLGWLVEIHLGRYEDAGARGQANLKAGQDLGNPSLVAWPRLLLGCVALVREEVDEALGLLHKCVAGFREGRVRYELSITLAALGMAAVGRGDRTQAVQVLREALQIVDETGSFLALGWVIPGVVALLLDQGQAEKAVELYVMASSRYPFVQESRWFEDVIGQHVAAAATLPPAVAEAAEARGRVRDEAETIAELLVALKAEGAA